MELIGIIVGLACLIAFAFRGWSLIWAAPLAAAIVCLFGGMDILESYTVNYMEGFVGFVLSWFPAFLLSALMGQVMQDSGGAQSITREAVKLFGSKHVIFVSILAAGILAYGGISGFVIIFSMYPIVIGLFKEANISRRLIPATVMAGVFTFAMSSLPGTPTIQNLIPGAAFGTTPTAAPIIGIVTSVWMFVLPIIWLNYRAKKLRDQGEGYTEPDNVHEALPEEDLPNAFICLVPFVVTLVLLNIVKIGIVASLFFGTVTLIVLLYAVGMAKGKRYITDLGGSLNKGARSAVSAIANTAAAVGFGSVVKASPGFAVLADAVLGIGGSPLISLSIAVNILAGATGSASGGMQIALDALASKYITMAEQSGISLEAFHRVAAISSGGLNTLPHDGAVVTYLDYCHISHRQGYFDMFIVAGLIPIGAAIIAIVMGTLGII